MATINSGNFCFRDPVDEIHDGDTITGGNFIQHTPGTKILQGLHIAIRGGNFTNCAKDPAWIVQTGPGFGPSLGQFELCTNARPDLIKHGLKACPADCKHRSAEKYWQPVEEEEFKALKDDVLTKDNARIVETKDSYGLDRVPPQTEKFDYTYSHERKAGVI